MPEADRPLGVLVSPVEVFPRRPPPLAPALAHHSKAGPVRETTVYEAPVGLFRNVRADRVHDRREHRPVALLGLKE